MDATQILREGEALIQQRGAVYGRGQNEANLGLIWTALLQTYYGIELPHPIPASMVFVMHAAIKANRAVTPTSGKFDDFVDGANYFALAGEAKEREENEET